MKTKQLNVWLTDEEYKMFNTVMVEMIMKSNNRVTISSVVAHLLKNHVNGNEPPIQEEVKIDSKDNEQEVKQEGKEGKGYFDGLNLDFDK